MEILSAPGIEQLDASARDALQRVAAVALARHPLANAVQLVLVDDGYMQRLNSTYRRKQTTTDVLSFDFALDAGGESPFQVTDRLEKTGGEIYISLSQALLQADERNVTLVEELSRLLTHGLLHLSGYEHDTEEELLHMERETDALLQASGLLPVST